MESASLKDTLLGLRQPSVFPNGSCYISDLDLYQAVSTTIISDYLERYGSIADDLHNVAKEVHSNALKVFCILALLDAGSHIIKLIDSGLRDTQLPVEFSHGQMRNLTRSSEVLVRDIFEDAGCENLFEPFARAQWTFLCPSFNGIAEYHQFDGRTVLPISHVENRQKVTCGDRVDIVVIDAKHLSSEISSLAEPSWSRTMHSDHSRPLLRKVVIKSYRHKHHFEAENRMLRACYRRRHEHIVSLLTSFSLGTAHHLMLPLATEDLDHFWRRYSIDTMGNQDSMTIQWMLHQIHGLVGALKAIHFELREDHKHLYCLHGDVKASNVLVFAVDDRNSFGVLKWADFGMSVLRNSYVDANNNIPRKSIGTHEPPECHSNHQISQKSDMWALGCFILEFIVWCTDGAIGLEQFDHTRLQTDYGYGSKFVNDYFFSLASPPDADEIPSRIIETVNPHVVQYVLEMKSRIRHASLHHVLDSGQESLLQIDPEKRMTSSEYHQLFERVMRR